MSLVLNVDGDRWRAHLRQVAESRPGLVPVIKGNGYGFGLGRLARKSAWLGVDTVAVGTPAEVGEVASRFDGDLLVLTPWRSFDAAHLGGVPAGRLIHTVGRLEDLAALPSGSRVLLELLTSMKRHGFTPRDLRTAVGRAQEAGLVIEGGSIHLPLGSGDSNRREADELLTDLVSAGLSTVWVSHLSTAQVAALTTAYPDLRFRQRIGTELWLGARDALRVTAHVLDTHPVDRGEVFGYRGRTLPRSGTILVVSGGTAHGIGLESPTGETSARARVSSLARGGLDALGLTRSPYTVDGKSRYFAEPPHMQASMLFLPSGVAVPEVGESVPVRVRFTATTVDDVVIS
jgi:alanine racemase